MDILEALARRSSIRAFLPDPVPRDVLERILRAGVAAPSKGNTQIWEFFVVTGEKKKELAAMLLRLLQTDLIPKMTLGDTAGKEAASDALARARRRSDRNREDLERVLAPLGLDTEKFMLEGTFTFFDAPVAVLVMVSEEFAADLPHILSVGAAVQNMLLAAVDEGLGACWIGGVWRYTRQIRDLLGIAEHMRLLSSVALGRPDPASPIASYRASRDSLDEFVTWIGSDGGK